MASKATSDIPHNQENKLSDSAQVSAKENASLYFHSIDFLHFSLGPLFMQTKK